MKLGCFFLHLCLYCLAVCDMAMSTEAPNSQPRLQLALQSAILTHFLCRKLRSAEAALHLLVSIRIVDAGGPLQAQLLAKSTDIVAQFARELDAVSTLFRTRKVWACCCTGSPLHVQCPCRPDSDVPLHGCMAPSSRRRSTFRSY